MLMANTLPGQRSVLCGFVVAGRNCLAWYGSVLVATRLYKEESIKAVDVNASRYYLLLNILEKREKREFFCGNS